MQFYFTTAVEGPFNIFITGNGIIANLVDDDEFKTLVATGDNWGGMFKQTSSQYSNDIIEPNGKKAISISSHSFPYGGPGLSQVDLGENYSQILKKFGTRYKARITLAFGFMGLFVTNVKRFTSSASTGCDFSGYQEKFVPAPRGEAGGTFFMTKTYTTFNNLCMGSLITYFIADMKHEEESMTKKYLFLVPRR